MRDIISIDNWSESYYQTSHGYSHQELVIIMYNAVSKAFLFGINSARALLMQRRNRMIQC